MKTEKIKCDLHFVTAQKPLPQDTTMMDVMARLDAVAMSTETPDRLKHYLERRSYLKALEYLDDPDMPHRL